MRDARKGQTEEDASQQIREQEGHHILPLSNLNQVEQAWYYTKDVCRNDRIEGEEGQGLA